MAPQHFGAPDLEGRGQEAVLDGPGLQERDQAADLGIAGKVAINGGKRGYLVEIDPKGALSLLKANLVHAAA